MECVVTFIDDILLFSHTSTSVLRSCVNILRPRTGIPASKGGWGAIGPPPPSLVRQLEQPGTACPFPQPGSSPSGITIDPPAATITTNTHIHLDNA